MSELGWKYLHRWQDRRQQRNRTSSRPSLEFEDQYIPLIQTNFQDSSLDTADPSPSFRSVSTFSSPSPATINMVNFSNQPDEIIVSEKRVNNQHEIPVDPLDMDTEKPYMSHVEQQQPTEGHSLGAMSTRDTEKGTSGYASSMDGVDRHEVTAKAEKKLLRKLGKSCWTAIGMSLTPLTDVVILPLAALLYLSAYLDRGNLGNARLQGLQKEVLDNDSDKYSLALACFYISKFSAAKLAIRY
jgi:hypothetical protein